MLHDSPKRVGHHSITLTNINLHFSMICVCFNEFCNSPVEINNAMELEFSPFEEIPLLPWALATPAPPTTTTTKAPMVTFKTIPTTLVTKPTTTTTTMSTTTKTTPRLTTAALVTEPGPGFVAKEVNRYFCHLKI